MKFRWHAITLSPGARAFFTAMIALGSTAFIWLLLEPLFNTVLKSFQWTLFHTIGLVTDLLVAILVYLVVYRTERLKTAVRQHTEDLSRELEERKLVETELRRIQNGLEDRILERTAAMQSALIKLQSEEAALKESEERYRALFSSLTDTVFIHTLTGEILEVNQAACDHLGYSQDELRRFNLKQVDDAESARLIQERIQEIVKNGKALFESVHVRRDGTKVPVEVNARLIDYGGTEVILSISRDISQRKQALQALEESERKFRKQAQQDLKENETKLRAIFEQTPDALFIDNEEDEILDANPAACRLVGYTRDELVKMRVPDRIAPEMRVKAGSQIKTELENNVVFEGKNIHRDGHLIPVEVRTTRLSGTSGSLVLSIVRDISSRKKAEEEIQRQLQNLTALRAVDNAINASLDLRVTLNVLLEHLVAQLQVHAADILLVNTHTQMLEYAAARGFRTSALQYTRLYLGEGYAGRAALERATIHIPDLSASMDSPVNENMRSSDIAEHTLSTFSFRRLTLSPLQRAIRDEGFISYYGVPLVSKGRVVGVLEIFHRTPLSPNKDWTDLLQTLATQAAIAIDNAQLLNDLQRSNTELALAYDATIEGWSRALDLRDNETEGHSRRVSELTLRLARTMGVKDNDLVHIRRGALLHDIGKMGIPDSILLKEGPLDEAEMEQMQKHPAIAYELLFQIDFLRPAVDIPYCHHERWDGGGYPRSLRGNDIPLSARIFSVVDVWDALLSNRPYRRAWEYDAALNFIRENNGHLFDPRVVDAFLKIVEEE
jgi:PAS domain S-box-containing protein/putative nucleotidyltransferase with HDIG domain